VWKTLTTEDYKIVGCLGINTDKKEVSSASRAGVYDILEGLNANYVRNTQTLLVLNKKETQGLSMFYVRTKELLYIKGRKTSSDTRDLSKQRRQRRSAIRGSPANPHKFFSQRHFDEEKKKRGGGR
jgi:hypothetical protein